MAQGPGAFGMTQISEIVHKPGAAYVGPFPAGLQNYTGVTIGTPRRRQAVGGGGGAGRVPARPERRRSDQGARHGGGVKAVPSSDSLARKGSGGDDVARRRPPDPAQRHRHGTHARCAPRRTPGDERLSSLLQSAPRQSLTSATSAASAVSASRRREGRRIARVGARAVEQAVAPAGERDRGVAETALARRAGDGGELVGRRDDRSRA